MTLLSLLTCCLLLSLSHLSASQLCNSRVDPRQFNANPAIFMGVAVLTQANGCVSDGSLAAAGVACTYSRTVLGDDVEVPQRPNLDSEEPNNDIDKFVAWQRDSGSPYLSFRLGTPVPAVTSLHIEFLNYPAMNISLPNLRLYQSDNINVINPPDTRLESINFDLLNNGGLTQDDFTVTTVSMSFNSVTSENFLLYWDYADVYNLDLFLVSEVYFCSDTPPTNNVQIDFLTPQENNVAITPTIEEVTSMETLLLTCTVDSAGLFEWQWRQNGSIIISNSDSLHIFTADGTRTSKFQLSGPSVGIDATYSCEVRHIGRTGTTFVSRTQILSFPVIMDVPATTNGYLDSGQVTLACEVYGFLKSENPLKWLDGKGNLLSDSAKHTITQSASSQPSVLVSSRASINGQRSTLVINQLSEGDEGNYTCVADGNSTTTLLRVMSGSAPITTSSQSTVAPVAGGGGNGGLVAGVVIAVLVVMVIAVVVVILVIYFVRSRDIKLSLPKRKFSVRTRSLSLEPLRSLSIRRSLRRENNIEASTVENSCEEVTKKRLTKADIEWQLPHVPSNGDVPEPAIYSEINKPEREKTPPVPPQNFDPSDMMPNGSSGVAHNHYENDGFDAQKLSEGRLARSSLSPKLMKVSLEASYGLDSNPLYEPSKRDLAASEENLTYQELPPPSPPPPSSPPETTTENTTTAANGFTEAIYAQPTFPDRSAKANTSDTSIAKSEPIYSEAIYPDLFSQGPESAKDSTLTPYAPIYAEPAPNTLKKSEAPVKVPAYKIKELRQLGVGQFGEVMLAETVGLSRRDLKLSKTENVRSIRLKVAVKKLRPQAESQVRESFEKEISFMSKLKDDNIVRLLAVSQNQPPFIVMEYMENGDLHQFLQDFGPCTSEDDLQPHQLPVSILLYMAVQVASGMRYLASLNCVHRDLATRNCLVGQNFIVKISDFGMSRSLYESSYYRVKGRAMLPIRWMASESFYGRFSEKTDVWSYGVTMWEIFTLAKHQPYEDIDDQEVIQDAIRGLSRRLLDKPEYCPMDVYQVMLRCWEYAPQERANFEEVFSTLAAIHQSL